MIVRAIIGFLFFFASFFALAWVVFRTNLVTKGVVKETAKTGSLVAITALLAAVVIGFLIAVENLF